MSSHLGRKPLSEAGEVSQVSVTSVSASEINLSRMKMNLKFKMKAEVKLIGLVSIITD